MKVRFCTLFDSRYATRGFVMLDSLQRFRQHGDEVVVLAIDDVAYDMLVKSGRPDWRVVKTIDLNDAELDAAEIERPRREFCWTCTPALSAWMVRNSADGDIVVYLDADLMFFDDPRILLDELSAGGSVLIHEHRFAPERAEYEASSGRFNVGFVAFQVGEEARRCAERWRQQTIELCILDPDRGLCGDQGYLTSWPKDYPNARVMKNIGGGVAPWNVGQYKISRKGKLPTVNDNGIVFYHYHSLRTLADGSLGFVAIEPAYGYQFGQEALKEIYRPYAARIGKFTERLRRQGFSIDLDRVLNRKELFYGLFRGRYISTFFSRALHRFSKLAGERIE